MANKINKKSFHERYALLLDKYPKTLEWVRHKVRWEHITLGAVLNGYESYIEELMQQEDSGGGSMNTLDERKDFLKRLQLVASEADCMLTSCDVSDILDCLEESRDYMLEAACVIQQLEDQLAQREE